MVWQTARGEIDLSARAVLMGILNVTPDSFCDGGRYLDPERAVAQAVRMCDEGADIIDVGGESTRPGALPVSTNEELRRVVPVIEALLAQRSACVVSVDTSKAEVARAALGAGAAIINDVTALCGDAEMAKVAARAGAGVVLMHMQGTPRTMQADPRYGDVVQEVRAALSERLANARVAGIELGRIVLDPGIGFGKMPVHNLTLLRNLAGLRVEGRPLLVGVSRKSFLGQWAPGALAADRLWPTIALSALLRAGGADVLRVHDVLENRAAVDVADAVLGSE